MYRPITKELLLENYFKLNFFLTIFSLLQNFLISLNYLFSPPKLAINKKEKLHDSKKSYKSNNHLFIFNPTRNPLLAASISCSRISTRAIELPLLSLQDLFPETVSNWAST